MSQAAETLEPTISHDSPEILTHEKPMRHLRPGKLPLQQALTQALEKAVAGEGKLAESVLAIEGMSGKKYRRFINTLVELAQSPRYLEVGSWAGSTLCSAISGNALTAVAIDNWSEFGGPMGMFFHNLAQHCSNDTKVSVLNRDFRQVDYAALGKFNIYLFDGPHEYVDQYDGLAMAMEALENEFVFIVDDWNWEPVRNGTMAAIADLGLTVVTATEIRTTGDNSHPEVHRQHSDWHNGYYISLLRK